MRIKVKMILKDNIDLRTAIASIGHTQNTFAELSKISQPYLNQIINKERNPSPVIAKRICDCLKVNIEHFFYIKSECYSTQNDKGGSNEQANDC